MEWRFTTKGARIKLKKLYLILLDLLSVAKDVP